MSGAWSTDADDTSSRLTVRQVARELGVVPRTVHGLINTGQLTGYWIGRVIRVRRVDLDGYLESVRIAPGALDHLCGGSPRSKVPSGDTGS
jgi:excisionase family DNA binding protein